MGATTEIAWTDATFNPWIGCAKTSPGCTNCYAAAQQKRWGHDFANERRRTSAAYWRQPLRWAHAAEKKVCCRRVFCGSLCDVLEIAPGLASLRIDLWELVRQTSASLNWLFLTKRPENLGNVPIDILSSTWWGVTAENQAMADKRIPLLLAAGPKIAFVSCEPQLEEVDLKRWLMREFITGPMKEPPPGSFGMEPYPIALLSKGLHLVIQGGESGAKARPFDLAWARKMRDDCKEADVAYFFKQAGARAYLAGDGGPWDGSETARMPFKGPGSDPSEWPEDLRDCRAFPDVAPIESRGRTA